MVNYYPYLISSLPLLRFAAEAPFTYQQFLQQCREFIPEQDLEAIKQLSIDGEYQGLQIDSAAWKKWQKLDTSLRNELTRIRAERKHLDPQRYQRGEEFSEPAIAHLAIGAYRNRSIIEAEMMLDEQRWRALDQFSFGHYFDLDFLIVYALELLILLKWERIRKADQAVLVEEVLK